ncbi:MAG: LPXTG cell wall anchor domain-containing protein [Bacilli bacterium]|nr:LPXTG cell wall anchor domain-containing protein [Bacilli bacterium]
MKTKTKRNVWIAVLGTVAAAGLTGFTLYKRSKKIKENTVDYINNGDSSDPIEEENQVKRKYITLNRKQK